ncbi:MAG: helix-turn-helix transcriptional regulator [Clostridia bacterium]|nr:helix-turn-helix transcriptional regulator [Clostridia bacterium]
MDTIFYENSALPVYIKTESIRERSTHSEIAHYHDSFELILINNGRILCQTDADVFELHSGDVCFINRKHMHSLRPLVGEECCHKVLIVGMSLLSANAPLYERFVRPMLDDNRFAHIRFAGSDSPSAEIAAIIHRMEQIQNAKESGYELEVFSQLLRLLRQLYLAYTGKDPIPTADANAAVQQRMAEYIYKNYSGPIKLDDIAAAGNVSRSQCTKLFNIYTRLSPVAFLNHHRLEVSLEMLRRTGSSVAEIAQNCGFSDQSYFSRLFQRQFGCTPLSYRKSGRKGAERGKKAVANNN